MNELRSKYTIIINNVGYRELKIIIIDWSYNNY